MDAWWKLPPPGFSRSPGPTRANHERRPRTPRGRHRTTLQTVVRVSLWMVALQVVLDAYYCLFLLTAGVVFGTSGGRPRRARPTPCSPLLSVPRRLGHARTDEVFVAFTIAAFLKFMVFFMVEMRYLLRIWVTSRPAAANPDAMRRELAIMFAVFCRHWRMLCPRAPPGPR